MKICTECKRELDLSKFCKRKASKDGLNYKCNDCRNVYRKAMAESRSEYRKAYYIANKEKELSLRAAYQKAFPEKCNAITAKRKAQQLQATPSWADMQIIENAYKEAKEMESKFGGEYHVHHIVPLVSDLVCGLHCHTNITVTTAEENHRIGNRYWPDMW
jgi:hypothetical protein